MNNESFLQHSWDKAHVILAHFPIALLSFAFAFTLVGFAGKFFKKTKLEKLYEHVWILQLMGTILIYPTMLFGERDYNSISSEAIKDLAGRHEQIGELTTKYYLAATFFLGVAILKYRYRAGLINKDSRIGRFLRKRDEVMLRNKYLKKIYALEVKLLSRSHPVKTFSWVVVSAVGFALLSYTGYLGGELVHEQGILAP